MGNGHFDGHDLAGEFIRRAMLHEPADEHDCTFVLIFDGPFDVDVLIGIPDRRLRAATRVRWRWRFGFTRTLTMLCDPA